jgi:hypothetical protein
MISIVIFILVTGECPLLKSLLTVIWRRYQVLMKLQFNMLEEIYPNASKKYSTDEGFKTEISGD